MIHTSTRDRRRAATHARIVDAALGLVARHGLDGLNMQALADAVGFTPGALYRYFASKDDLIACLEVEVLAAWRQRFDQALAALDARAAAGPPREVAALLLAVRTYRDLAVDDRHRFALISHMIADPRLILDDVRAAEVAVPLVDLMGRIASRFAALTHTLGPGDALSRAVMLFASVQGVLQLRKLARLAPPTLVADILVDNLATTLLVGWGAPAALVADARALLGDTPR